MNSDWGVAQRLFRSTIPLNAVAVGLEAATGLGRGEVRYSGMDCMIM